MAWVGLAALCAAVGACGDGATGASEQTLMLDIPPIDLANGEEITGLCYRWTLDNEEPLYVNSARMRGTRGIHHSNWYHVPEDRFDGVRIGEFGIVACGTLLQVRHCNYT